MKCIYTICLLALVFYEVSCKSTAKSAAQETKAKTTAETPPVGETDVAVAEEGTEEEAPQQYPFRDLPADVLRDFPGLCFGSTALRLFHVGQSWSLTPFCGVATCLVSTDRRHLVERVQDCGRQPKKNPKCVNVNAESEAQFPHCCPVFECEEGVELEYPTQEELQALAHEAAQAAVRAQYNEQGDGVEGEKPVAKKVAAEEETDEKASEAEEKSTV